MILVTGATGFLGSYISRYLLQAGLPVRAIKRADSDLSLLGPAANRMEWVNTDLMDVLGLAEALDGVSQVYHAAAMVSFDKADRDEMLQCNREGTANLINAALESEVNAFLHVSSVAAIGRRKNYPDISEDTDWDLNELTTDYALSKNLAEREVWRGSAEGLPVSIINPGTILGGGFWSRGTARFFPMVQKGMRYYTSGATGFVDVRDVARCAINIVQEKKFGERYIIIAENLQYREVFNMIAEELGVQKPSSMAGQRELAIIWRLKRLKSFFGGAKPDLTRQTAIILNHRFNYDNSKIRSALNYNFRSISSTMKETAIVWKEAGRSAQHFGILPI